MANKFPSKYRFPEISAVVVVNAVLVKVLAVIAVDTKRFPAMLADPDSVIESLLKVDTWMVLPVMTSHKI